jgi:hypothetical protein
MTFFENIFGYRLTDLSTDLSEQAGLPREKEEF